MNLHRSARVILFAVVALMVVLIFFILRVINAPTQLPIKTMVLNVDSIRGQVLFQSDCTVCHPAKGRLHYSLKDVVDRLGEPYLKTYLTKQDSLLRTKDPYAVALIENYRITGNHRFPYSEDELNYIIAYLR